MKTYAAWFCGGIFLVFLNGFMMRFPLTVLAGPLLDDGAAGNEIAAIVNIPWAWAESKYNNDTEVVVQDKRAYMLRMHADGALEIQADCNQVIGRYAVEGRSISISLGPATMRACAPGSLDRQFLKDLEGAAGWFLKEGDLYLDIKFDTGTMRFYRETAPSK